METLTFTFLRVSKALCPDIPSLFHYEVVIESKFAFRASLNTFFCSFAVDVAVFAGESEQRLRLRVASSL